MSEKHKIMIVENDAGLSTPLAAYLKKESFDCRIFPEGKHFEDDVNAYDPDLIILDLTLPDADAYSLCREVHSRFGIPVIIISAKTGVVDKVICLELGADDYVTKPFDFSELTARIRAVLRRIGPHAHAAPANRRIARYKDLVINLTNYTVTCRGSRLEMPPKEIELLYFLAAAPNQVFTREQLLSRIWGYDYAGDTRTVDVHIKRLREKLGTSKEWSISTVWGVGYKFSTHPGEA